MVVRSPQVAPHRRPVVRTVAREMDELNGFVKLYLEAGDVRKAVELSRQWLHLARSGGLIQ